MNTNLNNFNNAEFDRQSWFDSHRAIEYIRHYLENTQNDIRIASGFFTIRGWGLIRQYTKNKNTYLLVGLAEPAEERARQALIKDIMRDLRTGIDQGRRQSVSNLVEKIQSRQFQMVDARATDHHAKLYIFDNQIAIIASSNLTGRGMLEQIEAGNVVIDQKEVIGLIQEFEEYFNTAQDITEELLQILLKWLQFVNPWDIYLRTMLAFENLQPVKTRYKKDPVSYQVDMIAQTLRQIKESSGSMLVASTGLGKTVVAIHVALHLKNEDIIDNVMIVGPKSVRSNWQQEIMRAGLPYHYFVRQAFDKKSIKQDHSLEDFLNIQNSLEEQRWLLIIDESHEFRNRFKQDLFNMKKNPEQRLAFIRLREFCKKGKENIKVLLLTGSPYARDIDNINNQLFLLPHTDESRVNQILLPDYIDDARAWIVNNADEFIHLPVSSQLTTPHVAKYYGQQEGNNIYINFGENRRYIPKINLHTITFPLIFEAELTNAILGGCFDVNSSKPVFRELFKRMVKIAWASSPLSLQGVLERVSDTPGGNNAYDFKKLDFIWDREQRQSLLEPLIKKLKKLSQDYDVKLQALYSIIQKAQINSQKIIIFCERRATVVYLYQSLKKTLPTLKVTATIEDSNDSQKFEMKETKELEKLIKQFAPIGNDVMEESEITYDVFISTDAHGVGVNMQDASIVINYDIDWTPIGPTQRAGRILRFWHSPRTIEIYAFVPTLTSATNLQDVSIEIQKRWKNLMIRHQESKKIIDMPVLTVDETQELNLIEMASKTTIQSGELNLEALADVDISPYYQHTAKLQMNRQYALNIADDIVSARTYSEKTPSIYVLLLYNKVYHGVFYNPLKGELREPPMIEKILEVIACDEETEIASVDYDAVEELSHSCIQAWCEKNNVKPKDVERICALYLKPEKAEDSLESLLS